MNIIKAGKNLFPLVLLLAGASVIVMGSCQCRNESTPTDETEKIRIEKTIRASIGWAVNKDLDLLYSVIACWMTLPGGKVRRPTGRIPAGRECMKRGREYG